MILNAISAPRIFDGRQYHSNSALLWRDNHIEAIVPLEELSSEIPVQHFSDSIICPGFIDIQVNGGGGVMFNNDTTPATMQTITEAHRKHGTAYLLPTLISATPTKISEALLACQQALNDRLPGVLGIHLEGPWLNPAKKGAHDSALFYSPSLESLQQLPWPDKGQLLITCATERVDVGALSWLEAQGATISCGHSNATFEQLPAEKLKHIDGFTHLFNAMSPLEGRAPGAVGTALLTDHAWCSIITDGIHVHPQSVLLAHRIKPKGKLLIVTDAMGSVGSANDQFELDGEVISVVNGKLVNQEGALAGAHIGMDESVANAIQWGIDEAEVLKMASTYPAQALKCEQLGYLRPGFKAAATVLSNEYQSRAVLVDGKLY
ncbi:N-acetylglucosamine-6-phosphate deacetylase [Vibrio sinaloensis]|uniref:N-acetylglucosamine-6-phosphate deacetylase n=1 Tax=Photobacterium sp. (strain ATCC 43367) TaxID=379097 RepID=UPI00057D941D|nr:N-acetylglucosamine-6-phosphate deacetylase [Vibrio sinaloensis]KHT47796.1 N-acetylglucosamine-6-phosphate deacetylase [Vibrio sinaloensis]